MKDSLTPNNRAISRLVPTARSTASTIRCRRSIEYAIALLKAILSTHSTAIRCKTGSATISVAQRIDNVVDPKLVGFVGFVNGKKRIARPLPIIAHVIVVVDDHHQPASVIFEPVELRRPPAVRRIH